METNEMKNLNGNKHGEKETETKGGLTVTSKELELLPTEETPPLNVYCEYSSVKGEQGDRHSGPRCCQHSKHQKFRGSTYAQAQYARFHNWHCHLC